MAGRWHRPIHKYSNCIGGLPIRYGSTGPIAGVPILDVAGEPLCPVPCAV